MNPNAKIPHSEQVLSACDLQERPKPQTVCSQTRSSGYPRLAFSRGLCSLAAGLPSVPRSHHLLATLLGSDSSSWMFLFTFLSRHNSISLNSPLKVSNDCPQLHIKMHSRLSSPLKSATHVHSHSLLDGQVWQT